MEAIRRTSRGEHNRRCTSFVFSPSEIGFPRDDTSCLLALEDSDDACKPPAKGHTKFVWASKLCLFSPFYIGG